jgi:hypothetical protein
MIALLGPPSPALITRAYSAAGYKWPEPIRKSDGTVCENPGQYFGGPFFSKEGMVFKDSFPALPCHPMAWDGWVCARRPPD